MKIRARVLQLKKMFLQGNGSERRQECLGNLRNGLLEYRVIKNKKAG